MTTKHETALRVAIAEKCRKPSPFRTVREYEETSGADGYDGWFDVLRDADDMRVPNYPGSLDAMHEAEKVLSPTQDEAYRRNLAAAHKGIRGYEWDDGYSNAITATALQRAEAFVKACGLEERVKELEETL